MRSYPMLRFAAAALVAASAAGCAGTNQARYVYQDGDFGVVGIPENTDHWPTFYRSQAESLMANHFPEGHEIVRAEEVDQGSRTLTVEGTNTAEVGPKLPTDLLAVAKLGRTAKRSQADQVKVKECRIIYRRSPQADARPEFAERASLSPPEYLDPNAVARQKAAAPVATTDKPEGTRVVAKPVIKPADEAAKPAAGE